MNHLSEFDPAVGLFSPLMASSRTRKFAIFSSIIAISALTRSSLSRNIFSYSPLERGLIGLHFEFRNASILLLRAGSGASDTWSSARLYRAWPTAPMNENSIAAGITFLGPPTIRLEMILLVRRKTYVICHLHSQLFLQMQRLSQCFPWA